MGPVSGVRACNGSAMKVDYRVQRKDGTGPIGLALEERGLDTPEILVYWGTDRGVRHERWHPSSELVKMELVKVEVARG